MKDNEFVDFYETLQVIPSASTDTIDKIFRHLAQRYHPDNQETGDSRLFHQVVEAHTVLKDPEKRAQYDLQHQKFNALHWRLAQEITGDDSFESDEKLKERLLALLYAKCRNDIRNPGIGNLELERLLGCSHENLEFHLWYTKEKGWVALTETGLYRITAEGVDQSDLERKRLRPDKRITDQSDHSSEK